MGLYWKKSSSAGALISMMVGIVTWIIFEVLETDWPSLAPATFASLVGMVFGSLIWPRNKEVNED
jgi:XapX domain-containing protein